jgi:hypothetical protein
MTENRIAMDDFIKMDLIKAPEEDIAALIHKFESDSLSSDRQFRDRAITADNFYQGFQWDSETIEQLHREGRPALTFNIIKKTIEWLAGTEIQNRKDVTVKPVKGANVSNASLLTKLIKDIITKNNGEHLLSEQFKLGCIKGRSFLHMYRDFSLDPWTGDMKLEVVDSLDCVIDPNSKLYNLSDSKYFIIYKFMNRDEVIAEYPEKQQELMNLKTDDDTGRQEELFLSEGTTADSEAQQAEESRFTDRSEYRFRVKWSYIRKAERRTHVINKEEMTDTILVSKAAKEVFKLRAQERPDVYEVVERVDNVLYLIKTVQDLVLERTREPFNERQDEDYYRVVVNTIPVVPFGANFSNGRWSGIIDDLIDPQMEKNKLRSSLIHIVMGLANSGWEYEEGTLSDDMVDNLETNGSKTGLVISYKQGAKPPTKIQPNTFPQGIFVLAEQANADISNISGVNPANFGATQAMESGKLNELRQIQGITTNSNIFDNFDKTMKYLGQLLVDIIRSTSLYTQEEMETIVEDEDFFDKKTMAQAHQILNKSNPIPTLEELIIQADAQDNPEAQQQIAQQYQQVVAQREQVAMDIAKKIVMNNIKNVYQGRYSVVMSQTNNSPTVRNANLQTMFEISRISPGAIPITEIIDMTDLPNREKIVQNIQQTQEAQRQSALAVERQKLQNDIIIQKLKNEGDINEVRAKTQGNMIKDRASTQ